MDLNHIEIPLVTELMSLVKRLAQLTKNNLHNIRRIIFTLKTSTYPKNLHKLQD